MTAEEAANNLAGLYESHEAMMAAKNAFYAGVKWARENPIGVLSEWKGLFKWYDSIQEEWESAHQRGLDLQVDAGIWATMFFIADSEHRERPYLVTPNRAGFRIRAKSMRAA